MINRLAYESFWTDYKPPAVVVRRPAYESFWTDYEPPVVVVRSFGTVTHPTCTMVICYRTNGQRKWLSVKQVFRQEDVTSGATCAASGDPRIDWFDGG